MKTKHTPGPWARYGGVIHDSKHRAVARSGCLADLEESDANATLIAAAPELLEACREALEALHHGISQCGYDPEAHDSYKMVKAAIAKAEGGEQ